ALSSGVDTKDVATARLSLPRGRYRGGAAMEGFFESALTRIAALPGVASVGAVSVLPLSGQNTRADFTIAGKVYATPADVPAAQNRWVTPGYFRTMGIPLIRGRGFGLDDDARGRPVAIVDRTLAERYWPGGDAVGARLSVDDGGPAPREVTVVGVVGAVR